MHFYHSSVNLGVQVLEAAQGQKSNDTSTITRTKFHHCILYSFVIDQAKWTVTFLQVEIRMVRNRDNFRELVVIMGMHCVMQSAKCPFYKYQIAMVIPYLVFLFCSIISPSKVAPDRVNG